MHKVQRHRSHTVRRIHTRREPHFHSLRIAKKEETPLSSISPIASASELSNNQENSQKEEETDEHIETVSVVDVEETPATPTAETKQEPETPQHVPDVPDRKNKPKFVNGKRRSKCDDSIEDTDDSFVNDDDNESLISGIERLSTSPAPVPAPRRLISSTLANLNITNKHTYQNVPIPISPNNSQESSASEVSVELLIAF